MRRWIFGLIAGDNNAYCLLFWVITGFLFCLAIFVTITGTSVFQPKQAQEQTPAQTFEEELKKFDAEQGFEWPAIEPSRQSRQKTRSWIPVVVACCIFLVGSALSIRRRTRCIGVPLLAVGALGLLIILLQGWRYGAISLWIAFVFSFLGSLVYTPIAFRDEAQELAKDAYERMRIREQVQARINPSGGGGPQPQEGAPAPASAPQQKQNRHWWARILSMDLLAEFISGFIRRIFRFR